MPDLSEKVCISQGQNGWCRMRISEGGTIPLEKLLSDIDRKTSCICYFGGNPSSQLPFALKASKLALERNEGRILRIC